MSYEPFLGEIKIFGFNFAPRGHVFCNGQLMSIAQNTALFALLGTTFGGDGVQTFGIPNLQSRVPVGMGQLSGGSYYDLGEVAGTESTTLLSTNMPAHNHTAMMNVNNTAGNVGTPVTTSSLAKVMDVNGDAANAYINAAPNTALATGTVTVGVTGGSQPFSILQPYLALNFSIATEGIFPSRN